MYKIYTLSSAVENTHAVIKALSINIKVHFFLYLSCAVPFPRPITYSVCKQHEGKQKSLLSLLEMASHGVSHQRSRAGNLMLICLLAEVDMFLAITCLTKF